MPSEVAAHLRKEMKCLLVIQVILAEFAGTAILLFIGCTIYPLYGQYTFAMCTMMAIHVFGPISGAHINPGATIVALIMGRLPDIKLVVVYWGAQIAGGLIGYVIHDRVTLMDLETGHGEFTGNCLTKPVVTTTMQTFGIELIMSFIFFMATAARFDAKNNIYKGTEAFTMGFIFHGLYFSIANVLNLSMNSARSLPPAVFSGDYEGHWIYWIAPNVAAVLAGVVYRFGFSKRMDLDSAENQVLP